MAVNAKVESADSENHFAWTNAYFLTLAAHQYRVQAIFAGVALSRTPGLPWTRGLPRPRRRPGYRFGSGRIVETEQDALDVSCDVGELGKGEVGAPESMGAASVLPCVLF